MDTARSAGTCEVTFGADLANRLVVARTLLRSAWPAAVERDMMRAVGRTLMYAPRSGGPVVLRLVVDPPNLLLHFAEGAGLPDPSGLLRGEGRRGRYVCFGALTAADYAPLLALIAAATGSSDTAREIDLGHKPSATA